MYMCNDVVVGSLFNVDEVCDGDLSCVCMCELSMIASFSKKIGGGGGGKEGC